FFFFFVLKKKKKKKNRNEVVVYPQNHWFSTLTPSKTDNITDNSNANQAKSETASIEGTKALTHVYKQKKCWNADEKKEAIDNSNIVSNEKISLDHNDDFPKRQRSGSVSGIALHDIPSPVPKQKNVVKEATMRAHLEALVALEPIPERKDLKRTSSNTLKSQNDTIKTEATQQQTADKDKSQTADSKNSKDVNPTPTQSQQSEQLYYT
ncbi:hypothetical protein RFI_35838, partial [Reticulomyxa filosa]